MASYPGEITDENICAIFRDANDFIRRKLMCNGQLLYAYAIDGLISGADASEYVLKPITEHLSAPSLTALYEKALSGSIYNVVAKPCKTLDEAAEELRARAYRIMQEMNGVHPGDPTYNENLDPDTYQKTM